MRSTRPAHNNWHLFSGQAFTWWAFFAWDRFPTVPIAWQEATLAAGERHGVYQVDQVDWLDYRRSRDGYIGDFLHAHPERVPIVDDYDRYPPGFMFGVSQEVPATARLSYAAPDGSISEAVVSDMADLCELAGVPYPDHYPPMEIIAAPEGGVQPDEPGVEITVQITSDLWLPWNTDPAGRPPLDNRALSRANTARLNPFLWELRAATEKLGGVWGCHPWHDPDHIQADADGVHADAPRPTNR